MSMPARQHSLSRNSGFVPLSGGRSNMTEDGIQLTTVRSNASTGARKPTSTSFDGSHSNEKDQHHHHLHFRRGRRQKPKDETLGRKDTGDADGEKASLNFMGKVYYKVIGFSVVSRYLVYIIPVGILLAVPLIILPVTGHKDDIHVGNEKNEDGSPKLGPSLFKLFLWIEVTWLTVWAAKLVAWILPKAFMFFSGIVSTGTRKYATVLKNLTIPVSLLLWALAVWVTFKNLFQDAQNKGIDWCKTLETILGATFACSGVFLGEKAIVQLIGVTYHQRSFANRISASKREIRLLGILYDASRTLFPMYCPEFADEDYVINDSIDVALRSKHGRSKSGSATPMRLIGEVVGEAGRFGDKVTSAFGNIASEITGKKVFNPNSAHSIVLEALEKLRTSEALARRIWLSFVVEGKEALYLEDVIEVLGPAYKEEAEEAFAFLDVDENGDISLEEMIRRVVEMGKERKAIAEGMKDIGQALGAFDKVLLFVVFLICIFIFLAFFQSSFITTISTAGTALLSLSFIFAVTCQEFLGSCIFLFVKHPYDVGDRVDISDIKLVVERISLLYSVFRRLDTGQITQTPNIVLNNLWVDNISRSKAMVECIEIDVAYDTSFEDIELLRLEMEKFVRSGDNSRDFKPDFTISVSSVGQLDKLTIVIAIKHKSNWHNDAVRATRRSKFMCALALALKRVPIYGPAGNPDALGGPANPTYSVAVTDDFATQARSKSSQAKDELRMAPKHTKAEEALEAEKIAAAGFNSRPPVPEMGVASQWDQRDDQTLGESSEDILRNREIEAMRGDMLRRASTRGRRRAGESAPSLSDQGNPISPTMSRPSGFDEEATTGMPSSFYDVNRSRGYSTSHGHLAPTSPSLGGQGGGFQTQGGASHPPSGSQQPPRGGPPSPAGQR